jgi:NAD-dependent dihydropyrimidine dehydrogenase PreA subunit
MAAMFIRVDIDDSVQEDEALTKQLVEVCPVDIFAIDDAGRVGTVEDNLDECTLCDLCIDASQPGQIEVVKLYRS